MRAFPKFILYSLALATFGWILISHQDVLRTSLEGHALTWLTLSALSALLLTLQSTNFLALLSDTCSHLRLAPLVRIWALASLSNYLGPLQPGLAIRIVLMRNLGLEVERATLATMRQLHLSVWSAVLVLGAALPAPIGLLFIGIAVAWWKLTRPPLSLRLIPTGAWHDRLSTIIVLPGFRLCMQQGLAHALVIVAVYLAYRSFGAPISLGEAATVGMLTTLSALVAITPNNLGFQEILLGWAAHRQGLTLADSIAIATLFRAAHITGAISAWALMTLLIRAPKFSQRHHPTDTDGNQ